MQPALSPRRLSAGATQSIGRPTTWHGGVIASSTPFSAIGGGSFTSGMQSKQDDSYDAFLLDMDGVLHRTGVPIDGAGDFLRVLEQNETPFLLLTNECRYTNDQLSTKLKKILGTGPSPSAIYSAANSAGDFFKRLFRHGFDDSVYVIGEDGLLDNIGEAYKKAVNGKLYKGNDEIDPDAPPITYVVIGSVHSENTRNSEKAADLVEKGARLLYTCPDYFDRDQKKRFAFGMPMPLVSLIERTTGCDSYNLGKPNPHMIRMALNKLLKEQPHLKWKDVLFVGDSIGTDIRTAIENGIDCALVMSGTTTPEKLARSALMPNFVFASIAEVADALSGGSLKPSGGTEHE